MKAIIISENGGPDVLHYTSRSLPVPGAADVLVRVRAASVNGLDLMLRRGSYPGMSGVGDIPGLDIAGEVVACGAQVKGLRVGDGVCALVAGGGYAEYCVAPEAHCLPIPDGFDFLQAASLPEVYFTAWVNLRHDVTLPRGAAVLIHGGAGGVGMAARAVESQKVAIVNSATAPATGWMILVMVFLPLYGIMMSIWSGAHMEIDMMMSIGHCDA